MFFVNVDNFICNLPHLKPRYFFKLKIHCPIKPLNAFNPKRGGSSFIKICWQGLVKKLMGWVYNFVVFDEMIRGCFLL